MRRARYDPEVGLAIRPLIGMAFMSCVALTACVGEKALPPPSPVVVLTPASRECPLQIERGNSVPADQIVEAMGGHVPHWLPPSFGLEGAWNAGGSIWATWTDGTCREVTVVAADCGRSLVAMSGPRVGPWVVTVDAPGCGNQVLRSANCLDYYAAGTTGGVGFHAAGLDRTEGDRIVLSIPL
jgi:hypothetical protein